MSKATYRLSEPCTHCGTRIALTPMDDGASARARHESHCARSVSCPTCKAEPGERCTTISGRPTRHYPREMLAWDEVAR